MGLREPGLCFVDVARGELRGATNRYVKTLADLEGLYEDAAAFEALRREMGDTVVYEVTDYKPSDRAGDMIIGVTRMLPGKVGREYFLTRGHIHARADRPEMYYGESGRGLMLLESPAGEIRTVEIGPRTLCYVPPFWIHRSVNVGTEDLVMTFAYPADSGQDYDIIAKAGGMRRRIVDDGRGGWTAVDNASYRVRPAALVDAILAQAS
ncbi:glucose-6-phosphate isomerase [Labrys wisconsinensis]|uniref:Glucose-6-phosphate isomerase n=1 Tax=Labrys wisconsinensis TaxID=425677 RepID=A0ABU0JHZ0_9HYPH|nr:glucose-6-phosphate isomerase [Labrys wisconsinensis]MDQ0473884.1 glucose-6-phosphate isomerase [Labrys wisconsinensis]